MYPTFSDAYLHALSALAQRGEKTSPRGMATRELRWYQVTVADPLSFPVEASGRDFRDVIGVLEGLGLVGQFSVPELFSDRVKTFARFENDGILHGAYGARSHGQLGQIVRLIQRDPDTRQAVITLYDSGRDLNRDRLDIPCTLSLHFMLRGGALELRVTMRSNDAWLGMPYDFTQFAIVQATVAQALGASVGPYTHSVGSLHIYEQDAEHAAALSFKPRHPPTPFPLWSGQPDIGAIAGRARRLALWPYEYAPETDFELWAATLL